MAEAIALLLTDPDRRRGFGTAARARALRHFSNDRMTGEQMALLARLAGKPSFLNPQKSGES